MLMEDRLAKKEQGDYFPLKPASGDGAVAIQYIPYPKAISRLMCRLDATPEELAAWIWLGSDAGGLAAYLHANELNPPPRFGFSNGGDPDYVAALMPCWFQEKAVAEFKPGERFITGEALIERWSERPALKAVPFIQAKIKESRLTDLHPIYGATLGSFDEETDWPALATGPQSGYSRSTIYLRIAQGLWTKPVSLGPRAWAGRPTRLKR
jgi:hypothetical protein